MLIRKRSELRPYQVRAAEWMQVRRDNANGSANWIDMGLGKTSTTLTCLLDLKNKLMCQKVLVTGPKKVCKFVWSDEIETWEHTRNGALTYSVVVGTEKQRLTALTKDVDVYMVNVENLEWLERVLTHYELLQTKGDKRKTPFDVIVIDEVDLFKNRDSRRFKVIRRMVRLANYVIELTGTPATEGYHHLWSQIYLLDGGQRLQSAYTAFLNTYFNTVGRDYAIKHVLKSEDAKQAIHEKIKDITFCLKSEDYLQLPEENKIFRYVEMSEQETKIYKELARKTLVELADGTVLGVKSRAALTQKLAQLAGGLCYDNERNVCQIHRRKIEELGLIFDEANGSPLLVAYEFRHDMELIRKEFGAVLFDDKRKTQDDWNAGKFPMMLINPRSGGHGVNLQHGGHTLVRYGLAHSLGLYLQLFKRLHRSGQKSPFVNHIFIFTRGTLDDEIMEAVNMKNYTHEGLLNALRSHTAKLGFDML